MLIRISFLFHCAKISLTYLQQQGVETIDYLISSHYDEDHLAGLIGCLNAFEVRNIIVSRPGLRKYESG